MLDVAKEIGILLLKGHTMLASTCTSCHAVPLLRDRQGEEFCVACQAKDKDKDQHQVRESEEEAPSLRRSGESPSLTEEFVTVIGEGTNEDGAAKKVNSVGVTATTRTVTSTNTPSLMGRLSAKFERERSKIMKEWLTNIESACHVLQGEEDVQRLQASLSHLEVLAEALHMREYLRGEEALWTRCYGALLEAIERETCGASVQRPVHNPSWSMVVHLCKLIQQVEALSQSSP